MEIKEFKNRIKDQDVGIFATLARIKNEEPDVPDSLGDEQIILHDQIQLAELDEFLSLEINLKDMDDDQLMEVNELHDIYDKYVSILEHTDFSKELVTLTTGITLVDEYHGEILMCMSPVFWGIDDRDKIFKILFDRRLCSVVNPDDIE